MIEKLADRYLVAVDAAWNERGKILTVNVWAEQQGLPRELAWRLRGYVQNVGAA
jgi:hypothetical protein